MNRSAAAVSTVAAWLVGAVLAAGTGGVLALRSQATSPAGVVAHEAAIDHLRAVRLAVPPAGAPHPPPLRSVPRWAPAVPGEVGTVSIPALGLFGAPVLGEGVHAGALVIPGDVHQVGWDTQTPPPGRPGITLLAGHVNWVGQGEGAFGQIGQLVAGDLVLLDWRGVRSTWVVDGPAALSPNTIAHRGLFSSAGPPRLVLVTCGGPFSETAHGGSYADNVIVRASPAG